MAIGSNWAEIWEPVWGPVWQGSAPQVPVPDVVGQSQASATAELEGDAFVVAVVTAYSSTVPAGDVISQSPAAGIEASEGSTVTITVSLGEAPVVEGGGVARKRKKPRKRLYVEIDGNQFQVNSAAEAAQILSQARALAEKKAEQAASTAEVNVKRIARRTGSVPALQIRKPEITVSPEIKAETKALRAEIDGLYQRAAMLAELRVLLAEKLAREDEEEAELMLLL